MAKPMRPGPRPLTSLAVIISLIAATRTQTGLRVRAELDRGKYPKGQEVTDQEMASQEMASLNLRHDPFHGDWNYSIRPRDRRAK